MDEVNPYESPRTPSSSENAEDLYTVASRAANGTRYQPEAFVFLAQGFEFAKQHIRHELDRPGECDAIDLCWCLHDFALRRFGTHARERLGTWNVRTTRDFGELVYRFIELGLMRSDEEESVADFDNVFDFSEQFVVS